MPEHPINDDELMMVEDRLRAEAEAWRRDPPADLHERTMGLLQGAAALDEAPIAGRIGQVPHGLALAAACLALLITTWAALVLQSPPAEIEPQVNGGASGEIAGPTGVNLESESTPTTPPFSDILAAASLESELAALETDARNLSTMMTRQVRLIGGRERQ
jgi:hypothetical protein